MIKIQRRQLQYTLLHDGHEHTLHKARFCTYTTIYKVVIQRFKGSNLQTFGGFANVLSFQKPSKLHAKIYTGQVVIDQSLECTRKELVTILADQIDGLDVIK